MLRLFNTLGRNLQPFRPVDRDLVTVFTCGPSVYRRAHIGNYRTFLFEDLLVRYLEYRGFSVSRGMVITDIEDKAIREAERTGTVVLAMTQRNIDIFLDELNLLRARPVDFLGKASEYVDEAVQISALLLDRRIAYRHGDNIYFDPLKYPRFGSLYGLDMHRWPKKRRRFHRDTYPGDRWNLGDFILWHGCVDGDDDVCRDTPLGRGRPSWNIQDASVISAYTDGTLSIYCGGVDNLIRHHDYTMAVLESIRPRPMARFWLHGEHLLVGGKKMSKSRGNILYINDLLERGYRAAEVRFFLMYGHYRDRLDYSGDTMEAAAGRLRSLRTAAELLARKAKGPSRGGIGREVKEMFISAMDDDLRLKNALDRIDAALPQKRIENLSPREAASALAALRRVDYVVQALFD
ncbi:MAG: hypothetical protein AVO39_06540 [delta proteobacterium MLS_D]|nr:MAG: hypothetical protein AVO39_06540 [delta proteobacterium MLS_D]